MYRGASNCDHRFQYYSWYDKAHDALAGSGTLAIRFGANLAAAMMASVNRTRLFTAMDPPGIRRLAYVLGLPLIDGVFVTLVLAGVLDTLAGMLLVGAIVFTGSGAIAVILAELSDDPQRYLPGVAIIGVVIVPVAAIQGALAPTIASVIDVQVLTWVAAFVLLVLGARMGSQWVDRRIPNVRILVLLGILASLRPNGFTFEQSTDIGLASAAAGAVTIGIILAISILFAGARIHTAIDAERFRFGGGVALCLLGITLVTTIPAYGSLLVLAIAFVLSIDEESVDDFSLEAMTSGEEPAVDSEIV